MDTEKGYNCVGNVEFTKPSVTIFICNGDYFNLYFIIALEPEILLISNGDLVDCI